MSKKLIQARQDSKRLQQLIWAVETLQQHLSPDRTTITNPAALKLLLLVHLGVNRPIVHGSSLRQRTG